MNKNRKQWLVRMLAGGVLGMVTLFFVGGTFNALVNGMILGGWRFYGISPDLVYLVHSTFLAAVIQFALYFALGALVGIATLPFADDGKTLVIRSLLHFSATAAVFSVLSWLCWWCWSEWKVLLVELGLLALLYVLVWLGRLAAWWSELDAIREKLGLAPVPSPLKWRETMPSLGFALLLCFVVPALLAVSLFRSDDPSPSAVTILTPLVAIASFPPGVSLGKRRGFCPLYPISCGAFYLAALFGLYYSDRYQDPTAAFWVCVAVVFSAALAGNLSGAARYKHKQRKGGAAHA